MGASTAKTDADMTCPAAQNGRPTTDAQDGAEGRPFACPLRELRNADGAEGRPFAGSVTA